VLYDLAVVGSGGAGFAAAIAAASRGRRVVMVEQGTLGGTCVNVGCIPSKALLAAAEARHIAAEERFPGITTTAGPVAMGALVEGKAELSRAMRKEKYEDLVASYGWELRQGTARFVSGPALEVGGERLEASHYLVATGASPWAPKIPGLEDTGYLTSTTAMEVARLPESLVVVGGNYVGLELGQLFARLGTRVTLLEALPRLAPGEEPEISEALESVLTDEGIEVMTGAALAQVRRADGKVEAFLSQGGVVTGEAVLMATGRRPNTAGLGLEDVGVQLGHLGEVVVDEHLQTANPRIWAAGDVTGAPQFVYVAAAQGALAADNALEGVGRALDYSHLPRVTFTTPNIAAVGLTDAQAAETGVACTCRVLPLQYVPRAVVNRDTRGLVKVVAEQASGKVRGVHVLAANAGDIILAATYALKAGMTVDEMASTWCPYLTMAEALKLAAQSFSRDVSKLSCCAA
jgi:mercuric reductase